MQPSVVLLIPWLVFLALGLSMARLMYQAWQEQAVLEALVARLKHEKLLAKQKRNFVRLSSHYLRTPLSLITNGLEAMTAPNGLKTQDLVAQAGKIRLGVDTLLEEAYIPAQTAAQPRQPVPPNRPYLLGAMAGAFLVVSLAVFLLAHVDFRNAAITTYLAEGAVGLLAGVIIYSARRSRAAQQVIKRHFEELLAEERALDKKRNGLVKDGLSNLNRPLGQLKAEVALIKHPMVKPVLAGISQFEAVLRQFIILTSLESGTMGSIRQPVDLNALAGKIVDNFKPNLQAKNLQVRTDLKVDRLVQDGLLLEFVLTTIVDNAIDYSPPNGRIDIISRRSGKRVELYVRDQGQGIAPEKIESLFKPFSRAEDVEQFGHQGMGMDLYLDKLIMHFLGGGIKAQSRPGQGTVIKLALPV